MNGNIRVDGVEKHAVSLYYGLEKHDVSVSSRLEKKGSWVPIINPRFTAQFSGKFTLFFSFEGVIEEVNWPKMQF